MKKKNLILFIFSITLSPLFLSAQTSWLDDLLKEFEQAQQAEQVAPNQVEPEPPAYKSEFEKPAEQKTTVAQKKSDETAETIRHKLNELQDSLGELNNKALDVKLFSDPKFKEKLLPYLHGKKREEIKKAKVEEKKDGDKKEEKERVPYKELGAYGLLALLDIILEEPKHQLYKSALAGDKYKELGVHKELKKVLRQVSDLKNTEVKKVEQALGQTSLKKTKAKTEKEKRRELLGIATPEQKKIIKSVEKQLLKFYKQAPMKLSAQLEKVLDDEQVKAKIKAIPDGLDRDYYQRYSPDYDQETPRFGGDGIRDPYYPRWGDDYSDYSPSHYGSWDKNDDADYGKPSEAKTDEPPSAPLYPDKDKDKKKDEKEEKPEITNLFDAIKREIELIKKISSSVDINKSVTDEGFKKALQEKRHDISDLYQMNAEIEKIKKTKEGQQDLKKKEYKSLVQTRDKEFVRSSQQLRMLANCGIAEMREKPNGRYALITNSKKNPLFESQHMIKASYAKLSKQLNDFNKKELAKQEAVLNEKVNKNIKGTIKSGIDSFYTNRSKLEFAGPLLELHPQFLGNITNNLNEILVSVLTANNFGISVKEKNLKDIKIGQYAGLFSDAQDDTGKKFSPILQKIMNKKQLERAKNFLEKKGLAAPPGFGADRVEETLREKTRYLENKNQSVLKFLKKEKEEGGQRYENFQDFVGKFTNENLNTEKKDLTLLEISREKGATEYDSMLALFKDNENNTMAHNLDKLDQSNLILSEIRRRTGWWKPKAKPTHGIEILEALWLAGEDSIVIDLADKISINIKDPQTCDVQTNQWQKDIDVVIESKQTAHRGPQPFSVASLDEIEIRKTGDRSQFIERAIEMEEEREAIQMEVEEKPNSTLLLKYKFKGKTYIKTFSETDHVVIQVGQEIAEKTIEYKTLENDDDGEITIEEEGEEKIV